MINPMDMSGRTIVVAGASSGIGKATAIQLSKLGARVVLIARREGLLAEVLTELAGDGHCFFAWDLSKVESIENLVKLIIDKVGSVDGLVYSAGVSENSPLQLAKPDKIKSVYNINLFGFIELTRQLTRKKNCNAGMSVVAVSSTASFMGDKGKTIYASTKAALNSTVRVMAHELGERGIRVNAVAPGMTETDMFNAFTSRLGENSETQQKLLDRQYLGIIKPQSVANAISFLISSASDYITGTILPIDGGMTSC